MDEPCFVPGTLLVSGEKQKNFQFVTKVTDFLTQKSYDVITDNKQIIIKNIEGKGVIIMTNTAQVDNLVNLLDGYAGKGGHHLNVNVLNRDMLLDAQKNPEKYKHLVVRVAGYSALFTTLSRSLQDDIINRTEQGFGV